MKLVAALMAMSLGAYAQEGQPLDESALLLLGPARTVHSIKLDERLDRYPYVPRHSPYAKVVAGWRDDCGWHVQVEAQYGADFNLYQVDNTSIDGRDLTGTAVQGLDLFIPDPHPFLGYQRARDREIGQGEEAHVHGLYGTLVRKVEMWTAQEDDRTFEDGFETYFVDLRSQKPLTAAEPQSVSLGGWDIFPAQASCSGMRDVQERKILVGMQRDDMSTVLYTEGLQRFLYDERTGRNMRISPSQRRRRARPFEEVLPRVIERLDLSGPFVVDALAFNGDLPGSYEGDFASVSMQRVDTVGTYYVLGK